MVVNVKMLGSIHAAVSASWARQSLLGASVRLSDSQLPEMWNAHLRAYRTLDIDSVPDLYLTTAPYPNAMTIGAGRPIVVLQSPLIGLLDESGHAAAASTS